MFEDNTPTPKPGIIRVQRLDQAADGGTAFTFPDPPTHSVEGSSSVQTAPRGAAPRDPADRAREWVMSQYDFNDKAFGGKVSTEAISYILSRKDIGVKLADKDPDLVKKSILERLEKFSTNGEMNLQQVEAFNKAEEARAATSRNAGMIDSSIFANTIPKSSDHSNPQLPEESIGSQLGYLTPPVVRAPKPATPEVATPDR